MSDPAHVGGCQCGAVRFAVKGGFKRSSLCHCRMCQRATGGLFAPLAEFENEAVTWTGTPATFASSDLAERGFCAVCGTPLFYRSRGGDTVEFMLGVMARPQDFAPTYHYGIEGRISHFDALADLPEYETGGGPYGDNPTLPRSRQTPLTRNAADPAEED